MIGDADTATTREQAEPATSRGELRKAIALLQHQLNNPLAALLAEAQLLNMEPAMGPEQHAATQRITELTRRVIALVRDMDVGVEDAKRQAGAEPVQQSPRLMGS